MTDRGGTKADRTTLRTVADALGLSVTTVSRALKRGAEVHPTTIERVFKAAAALGYTRDRGGLSLRTGRTYSIGYILLVPPWGETPDISQLSIVQGLNQILLDTDYQLTTLPMRPSDDPLQVIRSVIAGRSVDAVIFDHTRIEDPRAVHLMESRFPFVSVGRTGLGSGHAFVDLDDEDGAYVETAALLARGFRRIALLNRPGTFFYARERQRGYMRALQEAGIPASEARIVLLPPTAEATERAAETVVSAADRPDAFVCYGSPTTLAFQAGVRRAGADPAEFGFAVQDNGGLSRYIHPRPLVFGYPLLQVGRRVMKTLLKLLDGADPGTMQHLLRVRPVEEWVEPWDAE